MATLERGKEIAIEAGEIVLLADARIGELTREFKGAPGARRDLVPVGNKVARTDALAEEGLSRKQAAECEKIAALAEAGDLDRYTKACREAGARKCT